jgi:plasmid maintenance system antidote protein VapI
LREFYKFWLELQDDYDLEEEIYTKSSAIGSIKALTVKVA